MSVDLNKLLTDPEALSALKNRFYSRIEERDSGCHHWLGAKTRKGYGVIGYGPRKGNVSIYTHRLAVWLATGDSAHGLIVMHQCDVVDGALGRHRMCQNRLSEP